MARWYLTAPHYLKVPGIEWQYNETDRFTGRTKVKKFPVPLYLNPNDSGDWNYKADGAHGIQEVNDDPDLGFVVVCLEGRGQPRDIPFPGPPTPDMTPIDDEAKAITDQWVKSGKWTHPIEDLPGQGYSMNYSESILANLQLEVANIASNAASPRQQMHEEALQKLMESQAETQAQMVAILAQLATVLTKGGDAGRRI
jgi:hypothetical protein